jgi:hypothetical protein
MTNNQIAGAFQTPNQISDDALLGWHVEVDKHVAQENNIEVPHLFHPFDIQVQLLKTYMLAQFLVYQESAFLLALPLQAKSFEIVGGNLF